MNVSYVHLPNDKSVCAVPLSSNLLHFQEELPKCDSDGDTISIRKDVIQDKSKYTVDTNTGFIRIEQDDILTGNAIDNSTPYKKQEQNQSGSLNDTGTSAGFDKQERDIRGTQCSIGTNTACIKQELGAIGTECVEDAHTPFVNVQHELTDGEGDGAYGGNKNQYNATIPFDSRSVYETCIRSDRSCENSVNLTSNNNTQSLDGRASLVMTQDPFPGLVGCVEKVTSLPAPDTLIRLVNLVQSINSDQCNNVHAALRTRYLKSKANTCKMVQSDNSSSPVKCFDREQRNGGAHGFTNTLLATDFKLECDEDADLAPVEDNKNGPSISAIMDEKSGHTSESHKNKLSRLCRICAGVAQTKKEKAMKRVFKCSVYSNLIHDFYGIDVSSDVRNGFPPLMCTKCYKRMKNAQGKCQVTEQDKLVIKFAQMNNNFYNNGIAYDASCDVENCGVCSHFNRENKVGPKKSRTIKTPIASACHNQESSDDQSLSAVKKSADAECQCIMLPEACNEVNSILSESFDAPFTYREEVLLTHLIKKKLHQTTTGIIKCKTGGQSLHLMRIIKARKRSTAVAFQFSTKKRRTPQNLSK